MTNEQKQNLAKVFDANANKQLDFETVINTTAKALITDFLTKSWVESIVGKSGDETRKKFRETVAYFMPHYVLNGTDKVIVCDFVEANDSNKLSKAIRQFRYSVDHEVEKGFCTYVEVEVEEKKMEKVVLGSGWEMEVVSRDKEGKVMTETIKKQFVPRKKSVWGYTKDVKTAIINAIEFIENEK